MKKRKKYLNWDETFMLMTDLIAKRSKDPSTQVGACIVNDKNVVVGLGYNGFPRGCSDDKLPWGRVGKMANTKYAYVVHAEANALLNASASIEGCKIYTNLYPCNECAKLLIQKGIKEIVYCSDKYAHLDEWKASKKMIKLAGIKTRKLNPKHKLKIIKS